MVSYLTLILLMLSTAAGNRTWKETGAQTETRLQIAQTPYSQSRTVQANHQVRQLATLTHSQEIHSIAFTVDGKSLATVSKDQSTQWWDAHTGASLPGPPPADIAIKKIERTGCAAYETPDPFISKLPNSEELAFLARTPDNEMLLTQKGVGRTAYSSEWFILQLWDLATAELRMTSEKVRNVCSVFWSPNGENLILVGYSRTKTRLLDARTGHVKAKLPYDGCVSDSWFGSDGCEPWVFSEDSRLAMMEKTPLKLWNVRSGKLVAQLESARPPVRFSPTNSRIIATRSQNKKMAMLWEVLAQ